MTPPVSHPLLNSLSAQVLHDFRSSCSLLFVENLAPRTELPRTPRGVIDFWWTTVRVVHFTGPRLSFPLQFDPKPSLGSDNCLAHFLGALHFPDLSAHTRGSRLGTRHCLLSAPSSSKKCNAHSTKSLTSPMGSSVQANPIEHTCATMNPRPSVSRFGPSNCSVAAVWRTGTAAASVSGFALT